MNGKEMFKMARMKNIFSLIGILILFAACATAYKATPLPFRAPASYPNATQVEEAVVGAQAFADPKKAEEAFGFDVRGAGMLPVQVAFENEGHRSFRINPEQTFLEDEAGNLWPVLSDQLAYERATKYSQTRQIVKEGAYSGALGAAAGAIIGGAIGIVSGQGVGSALGKGAVIGGAAGATLGGVKGYTSDDARRSVVNDLKQKSLENKPIGKGLSYGIIFFPGEAKSAKQLRLQLKETETGRGHIVKLNL
jgi:hypothetical protein